MSSRLFNDSKRLNRRQFLQVLGAGLGCVALPTVGWVRHHYRARSVVQRAQYLLGTVITITVHHDDARAAEVAVQQAFDAIRRVDAVMSIHRSESDLSRVNRAAGRERVSVDPSLITLVQQTQSLAADTHHRYDVTCLPLMRLYGFYADGANARPYPTDREIAEVLEAMGPRQVEIADSALGLRHAKAAIDLGSIGKGYAVDQAAAVLRAAGIASALIDAGGNIAAIGVPTAHETDANGWSIAIRDPRGHAEHPYFETILLRDAAVATSGNYEQTRRVGDVTIGHLFDCRLGRPVNHGISTTVVADNATLADAYSTITYVIGPAVRAQLPTTIREVFFHTERA